MDKKDFINCFDSLLKPLGFKKKSNWWRIETVEIEKVINLQRSGYSNLYYINYGYNLKGLKYEGVVMHIYNRLWHTDKKTIKCISDTLDLESKIRTAKRMENIKMIVEKLLIPKIDEINCENDILIMLQSRAHLNDIPIKVKEYLKLE